MKLMFLKLERYKAILLVLIVGVSIGMTTTLLSAAYAQEQKFTTSLSGNQEVPPNTSTAKGWAWFKPIGNAVWYEVNVTGIDKATRAHIHGAMAGENGDPIANLQITATTNGSFAQGNITPSDLTGSLAGKSISDLVSKMQGGETYVNVHSEANPNGEIRGQISSMANNVSSEIPSVGDDTSSGAVKTFVNESGKFLANIPGETNELLSGESESNENDTVGR